MFAAPKQAFSTPRSSGGPGSWLRETDYIDHRHPAIRSVVADLTRGADSPQRLAVAVHDYVRDKIPFGFTPDFYAMEASRVLAAERGFCNTKSTLFCAMLRASGVPARQRFYALSSKILEGLLDPGTAYVDHSVVEVYLNGDWVAVDSYIADGALFNGAKKRLTQPLGLGIRRDGQNTWDGASDSFSQFHPDFVSKDFGVFEDTQAFYETADQPNNKLSFVTRLLFAGFAGSANARIDAIREGASVQMASDAQKRSWGGLR